jgi:pre-mRNA branch site protein p14
MIYLVDMDLLDKSESKIYKIIFRGNSADTRGTAFVVYEDIYDAKNAVDHLSGFNVGGRFLICLYYSNKKK